VPAVQVQVLLCAPSSAPPDPLRTTALPRPPALGPRNPETAPKCQERTGADIPLSDSVITGPGPGRGSDQTLGSAARAAERALLGADPPGGAPTLSPP
jgi:hypothetical protein